MKCRMQRYKDDLMTINMDQNDELEKSKLSHDTSDQIKFSGESRRRFAASGLAVSGVILTLASRPVLGDAFCLSPSGFISGNTSQHGECPIPVALSAASLVTNPDETFIGVFPLSLPENSYNSRLLSAMLTTPWPDPPAAIVSAPVQQVQKGKLGAASYMLSSGSSSLSQKGKGKGTSTYTTTTPTSATAPPNPPLQTQELLKHLVIALLRARSGATPFLTEPTIQSMFYEWQTGGTFSPTAGVTWNASQIIEYLSLTQN
jgi:hypothetical protein